MIVQPKMRVFTADNLQAVKEALKSYKDTIANDRVLPIKLRSNEDYEERMKRRAAVLVPLVNVEGVASILFTVRAVGLKTHAAQVSFPGGHVDEGETIEQAATRELFEETNLQVTQILGQWSAARAYTGTMVYPVLGFIDKEMTSEEVRQSGQVRPDEVSAAFHLPIAHLVQPENRHVEVLTSFRTSRFLGGPEPIWGLTGFFLEGILKDILAPSLNLSFPPTPVKRQKL